MTKVNIKNGREPEQIKRMIELQKNKKCHFCKEGFVTHSSPVIYKNKSWFITANDFPYKGSKYHYLIVSQKHITDISQIDKKSQNEFFSAINWLKKKLKTKGESIFVRSGNMDYTGATLDHLHFHFLTGKKQAKNTDWITVTMGYKNK